VVFGILFTSIGGLIVAAILRKLDNVVKEYTAAAANVFSSIVFTFLFPDKFSLSISIAITMIMLLMGIFCYEKKTL